MGPNLKSAAPRQRMVSVVIRTTESIRTLTIALGPIPDLTIQLLKLPNAEKKRNVIDTAAAMTARYALTRIKKEKRTSPCYLLLHSLSNPALMMVIMMMIFSSSMK
jgi:hypothetical protein